MTTTTGFRLQHQIQKGNNYPLEIVYNEQLHILAAPLYNGDIDLYDLSSMHLKTTIPSTDPVISRTRFDKENGQLIWFSNKSGLVQLYDGRSGQIETSFRAGAPILDFDINASHTLLACGTELVGEDASILFWDIRNGSVITTFTESHSDDVTQIQFHPTESTVMMSGSTDGLVCLYNLQDIAKQRGEGEDVETAEDDALYQVIKDNSVSKIGFFGPSWEYLYSITHMETFSIWKFQDGEKICNYGDVRGSTSDLDLDYCVGCVFDTNSQHLFLTAGSQDGTVGILDVGLQGLSLAYTLKGGHADLIRDVIWNSTRNLLISTSEDGLVSFWSQ